MSEAVVVGSGPNGLACAAVLARAGVGVTVYEAAGTIGGGTRSSELTLPGVLHDHCSAVHPMGVASPVFEQLRLHEHGLQWLWPEIDMAHPLDGGTAGVVHRSLVETADGTGADRERWLRLFGAAVTGFADLRHEILGPVLHLPRHPVKLARFGLPGLLPATVLARFFETREAKALIAGAAAHSFSPLEQPMSAAVGVALFGLRDFAAARRLGRLPAAHRSISPKTMSAVPITATTSASMCPHTISSSAARCGNPGARHLRR